MLKYKKLKDWISKHVKILILKNLYDEQCKKASIKSKNIPKNTTHILHEAFFGYFL